MTQTKYSFKSLVVAYVIASAFFSSCKIQGQTTSSKDDTCLVDYVNPLMGTVTDSKKKFVKWQYISSNRNTLTHNFFGHL